MGLYVTAGSVCNLPPNKALHLLDLTLTANKAKVLHGIPRDPDVAAALAELEDEESENNAEDEKPKVCHVMYDYVTCDIHVIAL